MGSRLRRGGLLGPRSRLAGRSRDGRRSERGPGGVRRQVGRRRGGPFRCGRPDPRPEAGHHRPLVRRAADPDPGRSRAGGGVGRDRSGPVPGRAAAADLGAAVRVAGPDQPGQLQPGGAADLRAVPVRLRQRGRRGRGASAVRDVRGPGAGQAPLPGGVGQPQSVDRGQGRQQEPGARSAPDHLRREGPHRAPVDLQRVLQAPEAERGRDRVRRDGRPRPRAHDRRRLARGRRHGTRLRRSASRRSRGCPDRDGGRIRAPGRPRAARRGRPGAG